MKPVIGITVDTLEGGTYSALPSFVVRCNYVEAVVDSGGLPILLPCESHAVSSYIDMVDGVIIIGGDFDIDPARFTTEKSHPTVKTKKGRTDFEWAICEAAIDCDLPILAICGGEQLLNVVLGGDLIQHIPDGVVDPLSHEQPNPRHLPGHDITIQEGTLLHRIVGKKRMSVNSAHHQAVGKPGRNLRVNAVAKDGVIEGIEHEAKRFCLGVQWHPEYRVDDRDRVIFDALLTEAAKS